MHKLLQLLPYFRPYRRDLAIGVVCMLFSAVLALVNPQVIGQAIDRLRADVSPDTLVVYGLVLVAVALVQGVFQLFKRLVLVTMSRKIEFDLRNDFYDHLQKLHPGFYHGYPTGDLMARATNDLNAVRMLCGPAIMYGGNTIFVAAGALFFMLRIHVGLTLLALCSLPLVAIVTQVFGQRIHVLFERVQSSFSDLSTRVQENLAGARVVRAYVQEEPERRAFRGLNRENVDRNRELIRWNAAFHPLIQALVGLGFAAVLGFGTRLILAGEITLGEFVTFHLFLGKLVWPMIAIGWVINLAQRGAASMGRIEEVLATEPEIRDRGPLVAVDAVRGSIRFRGLSHRHRQDRPAALEGIDLEIPAGDALAVVGRTGSGKSTLLSLVPRLIDPGPGMLEVDGVDVHRMPLADLRGAIAMVPQETFLFSDSLRANIAFGSPEADEDGIRRAASLAGLDQDLEGFPDGLDTVVGERGITLSGGQKQRMALARALLRDPRILILDDCLSAVDAHTEETILRNLRQVFRGRTVLMASHRIAAARLCDRILVLEDGRAQALGSHDELVARPGIYADLDRRQRLEEQLAVV
ncbi:MAG: ABC transporter ATP-binding protein [Acidobacteriota bacterium]